MTRGVRTPSRFLATRYAHQVRRHALVLVVALTCVVFSPTPAARAAEAVTITVDAGAELGPTNPKLLGVGWNSGSLDGVAPLAPPMVRIDGSLHEASNGPGALDLGPLKARVAAVRAIGAEPQVILSYMPPWLARTGPGDPRDLTKVAPKDFDVWQALIEDVVTQLATAPQPARRFEVWNEPDLPVFWQDMPSDFLELAKRTTAAVRAVAASHPELDLEIGGPATAFPDPIFIIPFARDTNPDFVSWHFYGNHPFFGPDGNEGFVPDAVYEANARRNPFMTPQEFGVQVDLVRSWVGDDVELAIDEWNVAAGGFDTRHDTHEGAAFDAAVLTEMERAGLDAADFYRSGDTPGKPRVGEWGLVDGSGFRKPAWWVFDAWRATAGTRVGVAGDDPPAGLWARATKGSGPDDSRVDVIVSAFGVATSPSSGGGGEPPDRDVTISLAGTAATCADVRTLATPDSSFAAAERRPVLNNAVTVAVPGPSVVWIRFPASCDGPPSGPSPGLSRGAASVLGATAQSETPRGVLPATGLAMSMTPGAAALLVGVLIGGMTRRTRVRAR